MIKPLGVGTKPLPAETYTLIGVGVFLALSYQYDFVWRWPDSSSLAFAYLHYLGPLIPLFLLCVVSLLSGRVLMKRNSALDIVFLCRVAVVFSAAIMLHFNLKLCAPLINPNTYDEIFWSLDQAHPLLFDMVMALHGQIAGTLPLMANPYHDLFVLMFVVSFTLHGLKGRESFEQLMTATIIVLVLGGFSYAVAPAIGPFIFNQSEFSGLAHQQGVMHWFHAVFIQTNGEYFEPALFTAMPAAMPSLHLANSVVFFLFAWRCFRSLAWLYGLLVLYFAVEAVGLRWHYLIDIPVGVLLGWGAFRMALLGWCRVEMEAGHFVKALNPVIESGS
jgi:hypothetical protein